MTELTNKKLVREIATSGKIGELEWSFSNETLTISGDGEIPDYDDYLTEDRVGEVTDEGRSPWYPFRKSIRSIVFKGNISKKGVYTFSGCTNLSSVTFEGCSDPYSLNYTFSIEKIIDYAMQGYTLVDIWNIDSWFPMQITRMLQEFKRKSHGCVPMQMSQKEWNTILDRMIFCFSEMKKSISGDEKKQKYSEEMKKEGFELFGKYFYDLWW